jgi:ligand-binding sensor domain-containing protein/DNA-binding CsgD family transcriptional regulator
MKKGCWESFAAGTLLFFQVCAVSLPGQYLRFERLLPEAGGAPVTGISSILQDREGYLWFGTIAGMARYDGYGFLFYSPQAGPGAAASPASTVVFPAIEDSVGDIWVGTDGQGLFRFDKNEEVFVQYRHTPIDPASISGDTVMAVQEDRNGILWVGTRLNGLNRLDRETGAFSRVLLDADAGAVWDLLADSRGYVWVGTQDGGLYRINRASGESANFRFALGNPRSLGSNTVWSVFQDSKGTIWVGTRGGGLNQFVPESEDFIRFTGDEAHPRDLVSPSITAIAEDGEGRLWIGTSWDGLRVWDRDTGEYTIIKHDSQDADSLGDDNITSILRDASGIMWVGTTRGGINKCLAGQVKFLHYKYNRHDLQSLSRNDVRSIWKSDSGELWVGFDEGLDEIDERKGVRRRLRNNPVDARSLSPGAVQALFQDRQGRVWAATEARGLDCFNPRTGRLDHFLSDPENPATISNNRIHALRADSFEPDVLWVGTHRGLNRFDTRTRRFSRYLHDPSESTSLSGNIVTAICEGSTGCLWVGTRSGLNRLDRAAGKFERHTRGVGAPQGTGPNDNIVNCIHEDSTGILWVGTDSGLNRFDPVASRWTYFTQQDGLPGAVVCGILEDESGSLWLSTNRGLAKFAPRTGVFTAFGLHDGVQGNQFPVGACFRGANGRMYFGGVNGFNAFRPDEIRGSPFIPPLVLTAFSRNGQKAKPGALPVRPQSLRLSSQFDSYAFEFASLSYTMPALNKFAYRLLPRDREWNNLGSENTVTFFRLKPGNYRLQVKNSNPDGVWNEKGFEIGIRIVPPFWRTSWFAFLAMLFFASGVGTVIRMWMKLRSAFMVVGDRADGVIGSYGLTAREQEVLRLILRGASNKDIQEKLFISASTVRNHISNIYQKLDVRNRLELINLIGKDAQKKTSP